MKDPLKIRRTEGVSGNWKLQQFEVGVEDAKFFNLKNALNRLLPTRNILPGKYYRLVRGFDVVMSNTPAEINDHREIFELAEGHVLINGLGLGMAAEVIASKPEVKSVTVVEISPEVIQLVGKSMPKKVHVILGDAFAPRFPPGMTAFDFAWHDIWTHLSLDNLKEMKQLEKLHKGIAKKQLHWAKRDIERESKMRRR